MYRKNFSLKFEKLRNEQNLSLSKLSKKLDVSEATVYKYSKGLATPNFNRLIQLADIFDVSLDYLVGRTDNPNSHK